MPLSDSIMGALTESVGGGNLKTIGEAAAYYTAQQMGQHAAHNNRMNVLAEASMGSIIKGLTEADPAQAASIAKIMASNDQGATIANLLAAVASGQVSSKVAGNTPPVTP